MIRLSLSLCLVILVVVTTACDKGGGPRVTAPAQSAQSAAPAQSGQAVASAATQAPSASLPTGHPDVSADAGADAALPADPLQAIAALKARLDKNPNDLDALISFGNANMMIERYQAAADLYTRALTLNPNDLDVRTNLALADMYSGKPDAAVAELQKNLQMNGKHGASLYNLGFIYYYEKKDLPAALDVWRKLAAAYPNNTPPEVSEHIAKIEGALKDQKQSAKKEQQDSAKKD